MAFSAELLPRLLCRDHSAQEELRFTCFKLLVATCCYLLGNGCEEEGIAQIYHLCSR